MNAKRYGESTAIAPLCKRLHALRASAVYTECRKTFDSCFEETSTENAVFARQEKESPSHLPIIAAELRTMSPSGELTSQQTLKASLSGAVR